MFVGSAPAQRAFITLFLLLFASISTAAEYYVSPAGNDSQSGSSATQSWRSIAKANDSVRPGDTVFLLGGTYLDDPIRPARSGTANARITYRAYQNQAPVLTSNSVVGLTAAIDLSDRQYVTVNGLHVDGREPRPNSHVKSFVVIHNGSFNVIENGDFQYAYGWRGIDLDLDANQNLIINNRIDFVGAYDVDGEDAGDSVVIGPTAHHNLIEGNTMTHGAHNLLRVDGDLNVIRNNVFDNSWATVMGPGTGGRNLSLMGRRNLFELNIVRNSATSIDNSANAGMKAERWENIVRRNFIFNNQDEGISSSARDGQTARHNRIFHNTIVGNGGEGWRLELHNGGNEPLANVFKNNIVYGRSVGETDIRIKLALSSAAPLASTVIENNLIAKSSSDDAMIFIQGDGNNQSLLDAEQRFSGIRDNIFRAPQFVVSNPSTPEDFDLAPGSPGVDEAAPLTTAVGGGSGTVVTVEDAGYFSDGFSLIPGDEIRIAGSAAVALISVDYDRNRLTLSRSMQWQSGAPITFDYVGSAPDVGAREAGAALISQTRPNPPQLIVISD